MKAEEEKLNIKYYNGEAPEHEAEKEKPKEQPSQDHSKQAKNTELHNAGQKEEDGSESKKKHAREPESTDKPVAKCRALSSQGKTIYNYTYKIKL